MRKFQVGQRLSTVCWFTGGIHTLTVVGRTETRLKCEAMYAEIDGIHKVEEEYDILHNASSEYIVTQSYKEEENRVYAKDA